MIKTSKKNNLGGIMKSLEKTLLILLATLLLASCEIKTEEEMEEDACENSQCYTNYSQQPVTGIKGQIFYSIQEILEAEELPEFAGYDYKIDNFNVYAVDEMKGAFLGKVDWKGNFEFYDIPEGRYTLILKYKIKKGQASPKFYDEYGDEYRVGLVKVVDVYDKMITRTPVLHPKKIYVDDEGCILGTDFLTEEDNTGEYDYIAADCNQINY